MRMSRVSDERRDTEDAQERRAEMPQSRRASSVPLAALQVPHQSGLYDRYSHSETAEGKTMTARTLKALDVEAIGLLLTTFCYKPGETPGFKHILYCRWCSYASSYPHDERCIVARHSASLHNAQRKGAKRRKK